MTPPAACSKPNADFTIKAMAEGNWLKLVTIMYNANKMYSIAITGTTLPAIRATERRPPNTTGATNTTSTKPVIQVGTPNASLVACAIVFDCTPLKAKPKAINKQIEKKIAIQR